MEDLKQRTKRFASAIIRLYCALPKARTEAQVVGKQMLRSGISVAANYRAACRARSRAEFIAKMGTVIEESDETVFWLELLQEAAILSKDHAEHLLAEGNELLAIFAASSKTSKLRRDSIQ